MLRYYQIDLRSAMRSADWPPAHLLALIEGLPVDSAFAASAAASRTKSEFSEWRAWQAGLQTNLLLAALIDFTREGTKAHVGKKYKFNPVERPGEKKKAQIMTVAQLNRGGGLRALPPSQNTS